jgi:integrase
VNNKVTEDLSTDQLKSLLQAIEADEHPIAGNMMKLALFTGMRRGEMFKLKWKHLDFDNNNILIRDPKGGIDENIPMNPGAKELLRSISKTKGSPFVFPGHRGDQLINISHTRVIRDAAGLPKNWRPLHGLRHTFASIMASSGKVTMYQLQRLLTHKNPITTQRYAHLRDKALQDASAVAGEAITEALTAIKEDQENDSNSSTSRRRA